MRYGPTGEAVATGNLEGGLVDHELMAEEISAFVADLPPVPAAT